MIDGVDHDGASGEYDNVYDDVEQVRGGSGDDALTGNELVNTLIGNGGADTLRGEGAPTRCRAARAATRCTAVWGLTWPTTPAARR